MRLAILIVIASIGPAGAQTYPFEGRWQQGGNGCSQADVYTARGVKTFGDNGFCRFTDVTRQDESTWRYRTSCNGDGGRYTSSGIIRMLGPDRLVQTERSMQGQQTEYTRCP